MSDLPRLHTAAEVAEALGCTEHYVLVQCRAERWPHRKLARGAKAFTDDDYARVLELIAAKTRDQAPRPLLTRRSAASRRAS